MSGIVLIPLAIKSKGQWATVDLSMAYLTNGYTWYTDTGGYARTGHKGNIMHRMIWEEQYGTIPQGMVIDHINGDRLDNRLSNLRIVTPRQNQQNRPEHRNGKLPGVRLITGRTLRKPYFASINIDGKDISLGYHATAEEASEAYKKHACLDEHLLVLLKSARQSVGIVH